MKRQGGGSSIGKPAASASSDIGITGPLFGHIHAQIPWRAWDGGIMGAVSIMSMLLVAERLGAAFGLGLTVTAAIVTCCPCQLTAPLPAPNKAASALVA
jgi:uncharacterized membrane protein YdcZ (DUF606 family)